MIISLFIYWVGILLFCSQRTHTHCGFFFSVCVNVIGVDFRALNSVWVCFCFVFFIGALPYAPWLHRREGIHACNEHSNWCRHFSFSLSFSCLLFSSKWYRLHWYFVLFLTLTPFVWSLSHSAMAVVVVVVAAVAAAIIYWVEFFSFVYIPTNKSV